MAWWAVVAVVALFLWLLKRVVFPFDPFPSVVSPPGEFLFGSYRHFNSYAEGRHRYLSDMAKRHGSMLKMKMMHRYILVNTDPEVTKYIYATQRASFEKSPSIQAVFYELPKTLFTINGEEWVHRRQAVNPIFGLRHLKGTIDIINSKAQTFFRVIQSKQGPTGLDISPMFSKFTLEVMCQSAFGHPVEAMEGDSAIQLSINAVFTFLDRRLALPSVVHGYWKYFQLDADKKYNESLDYVKTFLKEIIEARRKLVREGGELGDDLLSLLLEVEESDTVLTSDLVLFLVAGNHTTAMTLSWVVHFLTQHADVQEKVQKEVDAVLQGRTPLFDDLAQLKYLTCVIKEVMRLKPVAWITVRTAAEDISVPSIKEKVPANTPILTNIYGIHRDEKNWKDPEEFIPERFAAESVETLNPWSYLPFSKGMRNCIGQKLAMIELQMMTAMLMQKYTINMAPGYTVTDKIDFTLVPHNLVVNLWNRQGSV